MRGILQSDPPVVCPEQTRRNVASECGQDAKLERSPGWNLVRAERSEICIFAYVEKREKPEVSKPIDNTCEVHNKPTFANLRKNDYSHTDVVMELDLLPGESRGFWKYHAPGKWFKQAKSTAKINNERTTLLFDSDAEISIVDSTFARKSEKECVGIGENAYMTEGRTLIEITLAGAYVYYFDAWVGDLTGQEAILGMDFMVPVGIRLDLADGSLCLPDEVRIQLSGRRRIFSENSRLIRFDQHGNVLVAGFVEIAFRKSLADKQKLWVTRGDRWVPTTRPEQYLRITNESDQPITLQRDTRIGIWLAGDHVPRTPRYVSVGSRRYAEWQNLAFQATIDETPIEDSSEVVAEPLVDRPQYDAPTEISKEGPKPRKVMSVQPSPSVEMTIEATAASCRSLKPEPENADHVTTEGTRVGQEKIEPRDQAGEPDQKIGPEEVLVKLDRDADDGMDDAVGYHEGGDIFPEDIENHMAVLTDVETTTREVTIDDIRVEDPDATLEECERLRRIIWKQRHILIGSGNAMSPAANEAICDIDVGNAKPVAQCCRRVAPQFREKLSMLIKGLLSATIITPSTSPWASPIVVIIKANGVDIRLCIDYQVVNSLTRLMVYPMPLINDLLEGLDKVLWYYSLDMACGFWVMSMTPRARLISAFITPFGLFKWTRMPFDLKNAPQIYQRIVDNALYGHMCIKPGQDKTVDLFEEGEPEPEPKPSILGRRSYVDDILVTGDTWDSMCNKAEKLLDVSDCWNLSISVAKRYWRRRKVTYLGHQVWTDGLEAKPKDLEAFSNLPFPTKLKSMQSFLGSLNYYRRFIDDFAVYAAILCELLGNYYQIARLQLTGEPEEGTQPVDEERDRWTRVMNAFTILKAKIISTPILKHLDPGRAPVISAALMQERRNKDGVYWPVIFTSRTLKANELNYGIVDKEVLALLRIRQLLAVGHQIDQGAIAFLHASLAPEVDWDRRTLGRWAALLSGWTMEITKCSKSEEEILGAIAVSITPRTEVDEDLIAIAPKKQPRKMIAMIPPTVEPEESLLVAPPTVEPEESVLVANFDGSARVKRAGGAYSAILRKLTEWTILEAMSEHMPDLTVNEAEYRGLLLCFDFLSTQARRQVVICGDSNLVVRQMRGEIDCKAPGLQLLCQKALNQLRSWPKHEFLHVKIGTKGRQDRLTA
ncbi:LOW QUALITY PROTEIN: reverse transcriptase [Phytophthora megakarya]|uniref:RNA-directed DNA polymerase n=1 Tax=Phytophthora megakarya TaxID=4795 RepID=A0A225WAW8_9STRA|nr:LOW QUALITY PROTEIN: reverse transcriptase [Phytophthora megakarya]